MADVKEVDRVKESIDLLKSISLRQWQLAHDFDNRLETLYGHRQYVRELVGVLVGIREALQTGKVTDALEGARMEALKKCKDVKQKALSQFNLLLNAAKTDIEQEQQLLQQEQSALVNRRQLFMSFMRFPEKSRERAMQVIISEVEEWMRNQRDAEKLPDQIRIIIKWMDSTFQAERQIVEAEEHLLNEIDLVLGSRIPTINQIDSWIFNLTQHIQELEKVLREERYRVIIPLQRILQERRHADVLALNIKKEAIIDRDMIAKDLATFIDSSEVQRYYAQVMPYLTLLVQAVQGKEKEVVAEAIAFLQKAMFASSRAGESRFYNIEKFKNIALTDEKTGAYSAAYGKREADRLFSDVTRHNGTFSVLMIDGDKFKDINDTYGHLAGDDVLKLIVQSALKNVRKEDSVIRYGGEEFLITLPGVGKDAALLVAKRIVDSVAKDSEEMLAKFNLKLLREYPDTDPKSLRKRMTVSIGVASYPEDILSRPGATLSMNALIDIADQFLYEAKEEGRNRVASNKGEILGPP